MQILVAKKVVTAADITAHIEELESYGSRGLGPRVIARAWTDPEFKKRLLKDGVEAVNELGIEAGGWLPYGGVTGMQLTLLLVQKQVFTGSCTQPKLRCPSWQSLFPMSHIWLPIPDCKFC